MSGSKPRTLFGALLLTLGGFACAHGPVTFESQRLERLIASPPVQRLEIAGLEHASPSQQALLVFFRDKVWPAEGRVKELEIKNGLLDIRLNRALYSSPEERASLESRSAPLEKELLALRSSEEWKSLHARFFELARGLRGELADHARRAYENLAAENFSAEAQAILGELEVVFGRLGKLDKESPFNATFSAAKEGSFEVQRRWFAGQVDFETGTRELEALEKTGLVASGQDFATRGRDDLSELAVLRTRLAKAQGFRSWAAYQVAKDATGYSKKLGTPAGRLSFLKASLRSTEKRYGAFLKGRVGKAAWVRAAALALVALETDSLIAAYFPSALAEERWRRMVLDDGFDPRVLSEIHLDTVPRPGKNTGGYNNAVLERSPKVLRLDARTLSVLYPSEDDREAWNTAEIDSLANLRHDGPGPQQTLFHEGGHALDFASRRNPFQIAPAYGYTETMSMLMELYVFGDPEFLRTVGVPDDVSARYRSNAEANRLLELRELVAEAIVDIEVWDYDFTRSGAEPFVPRAMRLYSRWMERATKARYGTQAGLDWRASAFSQKWLWGGKVRRFSYVLANASARFVAEALGEKLFRATGRRSLYGQPLLGPTLVNGLLRNGFAEEFPRSIERFAGKPFKP